MESVQPVFDALNQKNYLLAAALVVVIVVAIIRSKWPNIQGRYAWIAAVVTGALLAVANQIVSGKSFGGVSGVVTVILGGVVAGLTGAGLVKGMKELAPKPSLTNPPVPPDAGNSDGP